MGEQVNLPTYSLLSTLYQPTHYSLPTYSLLTTNLLTTNLLTTNLLTTNLLTGLSLSPQLAHLRTLALAD